MSHPHSLPRIAVVLCSGLAVSVSSCSPSTVADQSAESAATVEMLEGVVQSEAFRQDAAAFLVEESSVALIANPETRELLRAAVHDHASSPEVALPLPGEGIPLTVRLRVIGPDESSLGSAVVDLVQTDQHGRYHEANGGFNPWLFTTARTNSAGEATLRSFVPGSYLDEAGARVPRHIHFTVAAGERLRAAEFLFDVDPDFDAHLAQQEGLPVARCEVGEIGDWACEVTIQL